MSDDIPPIDPDLPTSNASQETLELRLLSLEDENLYLKRREYGQRHKIRWIAVGTGAVVILAMLAIMGHLLHHIYWGPFMRPNPSFAVAMIVAPIASITAITVALFVGAFRKFDDKDLEAMGNGAAGAANLFRGG